MDSPTGIAIVGMSGRFPGARDLEEFWANLCSGASGITHFTGAELRDAGVKEQVLQDPAYIKAGLVLEDLEQFDAEFFGMTPREAEITDPQHRIFMECVWEALENAGYDPARFEGEIGIFASAGLSAYLGRILLNPEVIRDVGTFQAMLGCDKDFLPLRTAFKFGLRGPAVAVQSACSSSLVAVHLACQSLLDYQTDMALAGGASLGALQKRGYFAVPGGVLSPDGHCRPFDAKAQGTVTGSGAGVIVLRRLEDALEAGDHIHAVIRASAINNDGNRKVGYTAPSVEGQAAVIREALLVAGLTGEDIGYVEAHGTGTELGDPVEVAALTAAFATGRRTYCALGSLKSNLGHMDAAAGIGGLIKAVLMLRHKQLVPSLDYEQANPQINFLESPFYVSTRWCEWASTGEQPRRAGVSSFGIGGTNAHVVVEEALQTGRISAGEPETGSGWQLLVTSGKSESGLIATRARIGKWLAERTDEIDLRDLAYTLQVGRQRLDYRQTAVVEDIQQAVARLQDTTGRATRTKAKGQRVVYVFAGQGAQRPGMGRQLYERHKVFRSEIDRCAESIKPALEVDIRDWINGHRDRIEQTWMTQPSLFAFEYALARLWLSWGVAPEAMIGHSLGEFVAACIAGVFCLEDALKIVVERGRRMQALPEGSMLAVGAELSAIEAMLGEDLWISASNGARQCVVSGGQQAVGSLEQRLRKSGVWCERLQVSHAFHSGRMEPMIPGFVQQVAAICLHEPSIPYISNVTGTWIKAEEAMSPAYWGRHVRSPVRFKDGVEEILKEPDRILLEIGPARQLHGLVQSANAKVVISSLSGKEDEQKDLYTAAGRLWELGIDLDWREFWEGKSRPRIELPSYAFQRRRHWIDGEARTVPELTRAAKTGWLYSPTWKQRPAPLNSRLEPVKQETRWLLWGDGAELADALAKKLPGEVVRVCESNRWEKVGDASFLIDRQTPAHYRLVFEALKHRGWQREHVIHLSTINHEDTSCRISGPILDLRFHPLAELAKVLADDSAGANVRFTCVTSNLWGIEAKDQVHPEQALTLGVVQVLGQEFPNIQCASIDLGNPAGVTEDHDRIDALVRELCSPAPPMISALRGANCWLRFMERVDFLRTQERPAIEFRSGGVYLITGGTGGLGLCVAAHIARKGKVQLILVGRSALPARQQWDSYLSTHGDADPVSRKLLQIRRIEETGSAVTVIAADVADPSQMGQLQEMLSTRFGQVHGVVHGAGIASGTLIPLAKREDMDAVLRPKTYGTLLLRELCQGVKAEFLVLFSSLNALMGGIGQIDYCAANAFLDASVNSSPVPTISINWDAWREIGMSVNSPLSPGLEEMRKREISFGLSSEEGVFALDQAMACGLKHIAVSTRDLEQRIRGRAKLVGNESAPSRSNKGRPELSTEYEAPRDELEKKITAIWEDLLGISPIGIRDSFFDLGGHSLLATQVSTRLRSELAVELPLRTVFEAGTVVRLAEIVLEQKLASVNPEELRALLAASQEPADETSSPTNADGSKHG